MDSLDEEAPGPEGSVPKTEEGVTRKYITTAVIYYCSLTYGISTLFLAPIVIDARDAYHTSMATLSWVFTLSRVFMLISFPLYGIIFNHVSRHVLIFILLFTAGLMMWATPYSPTIVVFGLVNVIRLVLYAGWATAQLPWIIEIWQDAAGPYIQGQHFCFALGSMIPSMVFTPFLKKDPVDSGLPKTEGAEITSIENNSTTSWIEESSPLTALYIPTGICAGLVILGAILQLGIFLAPQKSKSKIRNKRFRAAKEDVGGRAESNNEGKRKLGLIILAATLVGVCKVMETVAFQFLPAYVTYSNANLSKSDGAQVMSAHTAAFTLARLAGTLLAFKLKSRTLLIINIAFLAAANVFFTIASGPNAFVFLMVGSVLLGIGFSTIIPCVYSYVEAYVEITTVVASIFLVEGGVLTAIIPLFIGFYLEETPAVFVYLNFGSTVVVGATFYGILLLSRRISCAAKCPG